MKNVYLFILAVVINFSGFSEMIIDFDSGEYVEISKEEFQTIRKKDGLENNEEKKNIEVNRLKLFLPEDTMSKEEWAEEIKINPWKKWTLCNDIVTNDFTNTSSNVVVITFLDYDGAKKDGIKDIKIVRDKYRLCCVLHPGDKYIETSDGKNGVRLASYLQIHEFCADAKKYCGFKYMDIDWDGDGISSWDEVRGTNIVVQYKNCSSNLFVFTRMISRDTDRDGIDDNDEISGKNGFITDPTNPDTDGDDIPDGIDKHPTYACESIDPKFMPAEWAEYWSGEDKSLFDKLLLADADPDGDGFTNKEEKMMGLNPKFTDSDLIIFSPKNPVLKNVKGNKYIGYFNFLINTNIMTSVQISTAARENLMLSSPEIKYLGSVPLRNRVFKGENLFKMSARDYKTHSFSARVQPMTMHKFKVTYSKNGIFNEEFRVNVRCRNHSPRENDDTFKEFTAKNVIFRTCYGRFLEPPEPKKIPKLLKPVSDQYFIGEDKVSCKWERSEEDLFWRAYPTVYYMTCYDVFLDNKCKSYKYHLNFYDGLRNESICGWNTISLKYEKYEFTTRAIGCGLSYLSNMKISGDYVPVFKTRILTLDSSFVFKPDTLRNIRLQAKYGKDKYERNTKEIKKYENN